MSAHRNEGMARWAGRVAVVTGASSGIGAALCQALVESGMNVAGLARRQAKLEEVRGSIKGPGKFLPLTCDVRDEASLLASLDRVRQLWGGTDVLINNAGLGYGKSLLTGETSEWREMLEVNVLALSVTTRELVMDMRRRGDDGHVIHISSMSGHRLTEDGAFYAATKHAVRALTEGLRRELRSMKSGIRVTAISPGFVETEFHGRYYQSDAKAQAAYGAYKVLEPGDIAEAVLHALSAPRHVEVHDILLRPTEQPR